MSSGLRIVVFGPAYLDRVLRVDRPILDDPSGPPLDQSVDGEWKFTGGQEIELVDPDGLILAITPPPGWTGPRGQVWLGQCLRPGLTGRRELRVTAWQDDLGGMGAGYAAALGGSLHSALGPGSDPTSRAVAELLARYAIDHHPVRMADRPADWTLLVTSGEFADKLAVGFRGCHAAIDPDSLTPDAARPCGIRVVAGLPNRLAGPLLAAPGARTRFLAPAMRNMTDREVPLAGFASSVDILSCNRSEWSALEGREVAGDRIPIVAVTDGPRGIDLAFTTPESERMNQHVPAFTRAHPPRDTNRAGEAFGATLLATLVDSGWDGRMRAVEPARLTAATRRAAAAAALVLDRTDFGFPSREEIAAALEAGIVA
ncbi:MAG: PfkB family carbohydrate kinase [Isosphaeraceae bacterium]